MEIASIQRHSICKTLRTYTPCENSKQSINKLYADIDVISVGYRIFSRSSVLLWYKHTISFRFQRIDNIIRRIWWNHRWRLRFFNGRRNRPGTVYVRFKHADRPCPIATHILRYFIDNAIWFIFCTAYGGYLVCFDRRHCLR